MIPFVPLGQLSDASLNGRGHQLVTVAEIARVTVGQQLLVSDGAKHNECHQRTTEWQGNIKYIIDTLMLNETWKFA